MSDVTTRNASGTPCWFDMTVPDKKVAMDFYGSLFGWEFSDDYYNMCLVRGKQVAAVVEPWPGTEPPEQSNWTTYLAVNDLDATIDKIRSAGGRIDKETTDVMELGRMAIASDPTGGTFGLWEAGTHLGSAVVNEPGAPCWHELTSKDTAAASNFYATVFGYELEPMGAEGFDYTVLKVSGEPVGGIYGDADQRPSAGHGAWLIYFGIDDTDAAARQATASGGKVLSSPEDTPYGRMAILADPFGAHLAVIKLPQG